MNKTFPAYGVFGILLLILSELLSLRKVDPFYSWFYCFAWWSYILTIDAIIHRIKGNSLIANRTKEFFLMTPWSIFIWLIFEGANLFLENWYYINLPHSFAERWLGYAIAYATVLPGLFETTELLESLGLFKKAITKKILISRATHILLILLGTICLASSILIPQYFFPSIWMGFIFLLEPFNYWFGGRSLLKDLEEGNPRKIYLLLMAGLICGFLWEFWNFWALSKWIYTVPFFEKLKGFEMPYLGFLGFLPFAIQAYVMYNFISLFRFRRGWEEPTNRLNLEKRTRSLTAILTAILIGSFCVLVFRAIDFKTVDSYYPRLKDAYWIESKYREELPRVGVATLSELLVKTRNKRDRDELALRLLIPKEDLIQWIEKAQLVQLKGLGIENLQLLEGVEIYSISTLAEQDLDTLYEMMKTQFPGRHLPRKAILRIWIREARKTIKSKSYEL
jgi:hypothetical protein